MKSTKRLILTVVIALGALGVYAAVFWSIYSIADDTNRLAQETADSQERISEERKLNNLAKDIRPSSDQLESVVVAKDGDIHFIESLETLGKEQGVDLSIVSVDESQGAKFNNLVFRIAATGSWERLVHLVNLLELMPYKTAIQSVAFNLPEDTPQKKSLGWSLAVQMTVAKEK